MLTLDFFFPTGNVNSSEDKDKHRFVRKMNYVNYKPHAVFSSWKPGMIMQNYRMGISQCRIYYINTQSFSVHFK